MKKRHYRPRVHAVEGVRWSRILELVAYFEGCRKVDLVTTSLSEFLECKLDDIISAFESENPSDFPIEETRRHLKKLREYNRRKR